MPEVDAVVVTDFLDPQTTFEHVCTFLPVERVLAPSVLRISREPPTLMD